MEVKLVPPIPTEDKVVITLSRKEAEHLSSILYMVGGRNIITNVVVSNSPSLFQKLRNVGINPIKSAKCSNPFFCVDID